MPERLSEEQAYDVLGLEPDGEDKTEEEIRKAYKKMSLATHPDKNPNDPEATAKFQQVGEAYMSLTDPSYYSDEESSDEDEDSEGSDVYGDGGRHHHHHHHHHRSSSGGGPGSGYRRAGMDKARACFFFHYREDFMDLFSEVFCMGGFGDGYGPAGIKISGPGGGVYMPMPSGFSRGGGGMFGGGGGMMGGGRQVYYDDESDDEDDYDDSEYVSSSNTGFRSRLEQERQMKFEAWQAKQEARKARKAAKAKKQR
ncbi:unnamed protein product, partial [Hapterophycus canaliculatus]